MTFQNTSLALELTNHVVIYKKESFSLTGKWLMISHAYSESLSLFPFSYTLLLTFYQGQRAIDAHANDEWQGKEVGKKENAVMTRARCENVKLLIC